MNTPDNSGYPKLVHPTTRYTAGEAGRTPHYYGSHCIDVNESFAFEISPINPPGQGHPYWEFYFHNKPPLPTPIDDNTVMLWGHQVGRRFTGCNPTLSENDETLGFELVVTPSTIHCRHPDTKEIEMTAMDSQQRDDFLQLNEQENDRPVYGDSGASHIEVGWRNTLRIYFKVYFGGVQHYRATSAAIVPPSGSDVRGICGVGKPPVPLYGQSAGNCWRPQVLWVWNNY